MNLRRKAIVSYREDSDTDEEKTSKRHKASSDDDFDSVQENSSDSPNDEASVATKSKGEGPHQCPECAEQFTRLSRLDSHYQTHHKPDDMRFRCNLPRCLYQSPFSEKIYGHIVRIHFPADVNLSKLSKEDIYSRHIVDTGPKKFAKEAKEKRCENCGNTNSSRWYKIENKRLCSGCGQYRRKKGEDRPIEMAMKTPQKRNKLDTSGRVCVNCHTHSPREWNKGKKEGEFLCKNCYAYKKVHSGKARPQEVIQNGPKLHVFAGIETLDYSFIESSASNSTAAATAAEASD